MQSVIANAVAMVRDIRRVSGFLKFKWNSPHHQNWAGILRHHVRRCPPTMSFALRLGKVTRSPRASATESLVTFVEVHQPEVAEAGILHKNEDLFRCHHRGGSFYCECRAESGDFTGVARLRNADPLSGRG